MGSVDDESNSNYDICLVEDEYVGLDGMNFNSISFDLLTVTIQVSYYASRLMILI